MNLNQVTIPSRDVAKSTEFYKKLGLKLIVDAIPKYVRFECPDGAATFSIQHFDELGTNNIHVYFEVENLEETYNKLVKEGIAFTLPPTDQPWLWKEAHLLDPDDNHIIIYHAGKNRKDPPWRIVD